jgi:hypothetical protein
MLPTQTFFNILNQSECTDGPNTLEVQEAFAFISNNVPKNETVAFRYPGFISMYTRHHDLGSYNWNGKQLYAHSKNQGIHFFLLRKDDSGYSQFNQSPKKGPVFIPVFENAKYTLFQEV